MYPMIHTKQIFHSKISWNLPPTRLFGLRVGLVTWFGKKSHYFLQVDANGKGFSKGDGVMGFFLSTDTKCSKNELESW